MTLMADVELNMNLLAKSATCSGRSSIEADINKMPQ